MPNLVTLFLQIGVVLISARLIGMLFRYIRQPQVIGEMVAGILLGPSLLGWLAPGVSAALFPPESIGYLSTLSQLGLVLFMFVVGLEIDPRSMRDQKTAAVLTSHVSIVAPFLLGTGLALYLYPRLSDDSVTFIGFALFMGAAMSVTAFPVLARILMERQLLRTKLGNLAIATAAVDDVTAWCILACIVVLVRSTDGATPLWITLTGSGAFVLVMLFGVRRLLRRFETSFRNRGRVTDDAVALILLLVLASALITEWLGIHMVFGAFMLGAIMPKRHEFVAHLLEKLQSLTVILLLPLFFAFSGLRTRIGLLESGEMWMFTGYIILVAVAGKFGGSMVSARMAGMPLREATAIGVLMNTRGLMELIILNIGLDIKVISPALFSMMVIMALVTTFMTTPLLDWIYPVRFAKTTQAPGKNQAA